MDEPDILAEARAAHTIIQNYEAGIACAGDLALHADKMSESCAHIRSRPEDKC